MDLRSPEELAVFDKWTKTDYKKHAGEVWGEVGVKMNEIVWGHWEADWEDRSPETYLHPDVHGDGESEAFGRWPPRRRYENIWLRQAALAIYENVLAFKPDAGMLKNLTGFKQSHWNFQLLGTLGSYVKYPNEHTAEYSRVEQQFTEYFLVKLVHRLKQHGITIDWERLNNSLIEGCRWRVMASPASSLLRKKWALEYGHNPLPHIDYPAPWKIANQYKVEIQLAPKSRFKRMVPVSIVENDREVEVTHKRQPCRVQVDGVFFIPPGGVQVNDIGKRDTLWVLNGAEDPRARFDSGESREKLLAEMCDTLMKQLRELQVKSDVDTEIIHVLEQDLKTAREEVIRLRKKLKASLEVTVVIDPRTGKAKIKS